MSVPVITRRTAIGVGGSLLLTAAAAGDAKAQELDGELLAASAVYSRIEVAYWRAMAAEETLPFGPEREALISDTRALGARQNALWDAVAAMPARTPEGLRAKALVLRTWLAEPSTDACCDPDQALAWSLAADVLGRPA